MDFLAIANKMLLQRSVAPFLKKGVMVLNPKTASSPGDGHGPHTRDSAQRGREDLRQGRAEEVGRHPVQDPAPNAGPGGQHRRTMQGALEDVRDAEHAKSAMCVVTLGISGALSTSRLRHDFLWAVLQKHGVTEDVIRTLQSMYDGASTISPSTACSPPPYRAKGASGRAVR